MRKKIIVLLFVLLAIASSLAFVACKKDCNKLGHDWQADAVTKEPTCEDEGEQIYECSVCHEQENRDIDANSHSYGYLRDFLEPTCVSDGNVAYYQCSECGQYFDANKTPIESVVIPASGVHSWEAGQVTKQATCTDIGMQTYECSVCHEQKSVELDVIDHAYGEIHNAVEATCVKGGNVAYYQCSGCGQFFDSNKAPLDEIAISPTGKHLWDLASNNVKWIWPDTYAEFISVGVKAEIRCTNCDEKVARVATPIKDTSLSVEPTYTQQGTYVFKALVRFANTILTDDAGHVYTDVPVLPDGRPQQDYVLVCESKIRTWGVNFKQMTWNIEEQAFEIEQSFAVSDTWKIKAVGTDEEYGGNEIGAVTCEKGLTEFLPDLYTVISGGESDGSVRMRYGCTLAIKLDLAAGKINIHLKEVEVKEIECYFSRGTEGVIEDESNFKFTKQSDGTYTLHNVTLEAVENKVTFNIIYDGVVVNFDSDRLVTSQQDFMFIQKNGYIQANMACTVNLTYDPVSNTLKIDILE